MFTLVIILIEYTQSAFNLQTCKYFVAHKSQDRCVYAYVLNSGHNLFENITKRTWSSVEELGTNFNMRIWAKHLVIRQQQYRFA